MATTPELALLAIFDERQSSRLPDYLYTQSSRLLTHSWPLVPTPEPRMQTKQYAAIVPEISP